MAPAVDNGSGKNCQDYGCLSGTPAFTLYLQRNLVWKDEITLWTDVIQKSPGSIREHGNLGLAYIKAKKYDTAKEYLTKAITIGHNDKSSNFGFAARTKYIAIAHDNLGLAHRETGNYPEALFHAEQALKLESDRPNALVTLSITYSKLGQDLNAYNYFSKASREGLSRLICITTGP